MASPSAIFERIIEPQQGGFATEHARYVLSLDFSPAEQARYAELADRSQSGFLSDAEREELDAFLSVNAMLTILQSKARVSLKKHTPAA